MLSVLICGIWKGGLEHSFVAVIVVVVAGFLNLLLQ